MENKYRTLQVLAGIVSETAHPTQYQCTMREMVLHTVFDWKYIQQHLADLESEGLVQQIKKEPFYFSITEQGLVRSSGLESLPDNSLKLIYSELMT